VAQAKNLDIEPKKCKKKFQKTYGTPYF